MSAHKKVAIQSAQTVTVLRALAAKEKDPAVRCGDYLAKNFLTDPYRWLVQMVPHRLLKKLIDVKSPGSYCFIIARTQHFDRTLLQEVAAGIQQVVLLGAGYDTRAFRFAAHLKNIPVFEIDFPGTQNYKKKRLEQQFNRIAADITFIPLDFNEGPFDQALINNGFLPQLKTLFLWEGVSYYLSQQVVEQVLTFVSSCGNGSSILFDYATRDFVQGDHSGYGGKQVAKWLKRIKEPFLFGMNAAETPGFLAHCRLSLLSDYGPEDVEKLYLTTSNGLLLGKTLQHVRMAHAKVL